MAWYDKVNVKYVSRVFRGPGPVDLWRGEQRSLRKIGLGGYADIRQKAMSNVGWNKVEREFDRFTGKTSHPKGEGYGNTAAQYVFGSPETYGRVMDWYSQGYRKCALYPKGHRKACPEEKFEMPDFSEPWDPGSPGVAPGAFGFSLPPWAMTAALVAGAAGVAYVASER